MSKASVLTTARCSKLFVSSNALFCYDCFSVAWFSATDCFRCVFLEVDVSWRGTSLSQAGVVLGQSDAILMLPGAMRVILERVFEVNESTDVRFGRFQHDASVF